MITLALDATEQACSVAVTDGVQCIEKVEQAPRRHAELLLPLIDVVLAEAGWVPNDIDLLAVTTGPGAFTGLRIAVSAAQGLAFAWNRPVMPVSTLAALARGAHRIGGGNYFLPAMDARIEQIYWGIYQIIKGIPSPLCVDQLSRAEMDFSSLISGLDCSVQEKLKRIGSGWGFIEHICHAQDVAFCAQAAIEQGRSPLMAEQLLPVYIREAQFKKLAV